MQNVPGGKINILGDHSIGHSNQTSVLHMCPVPNSFRDSAVSLYTDEQYVMSSHEMQSALMLTVAFSKMYINTR
jgi:hypothetical protein